MHVTLKEFVCCQMPLFCASVTDFIKLRSINSNANWMDVYDVNDVGGTWRNGKQRGRSSSMCLNIVITNLMHLLRDIHTMSEKNIYK